MRWKLPKKLPPKFQKENWGESTNSHGVQSHGSPGDAPSTHTKSNFFDDMKYVAAYLLSSLSGKSPSPEDVTTILKTAGADVDADRVQALFKSLEGKVLLS